MVSTFVDTSALMAVLDADDEAHVKAKAAWRAMLQADEDLVTSNYVLLETASIVQARLGLDAVRTLTEEVAPALRVRWVDEPIHTMAVASVLAAARRKLSLVDCSSFAVMQEMGLRRAFAFDRHFRERGFEMVG